MAENCDFSLLRLASNRALGADDLARERDTLATLNARAKLAVGTARACRTIARGVAHLTFTKGIADANNHKPFGTPSANASQ
jgi:hypothetical protein